MMKNLLPAKDALDETTSRFLGLLRGLPATCMIYFRQSTATALIALGLFATMLPAPIAFAAQSDSGLGIDAGSLDRMERAAVAYGNIAAQGGWPRFGDGPTIHPGDGDRRVLALRQLLVLTGDLVTDNPLRPDILTPELAEALRRYQLRHGLTPDGVIGRSTQAALDIPASERARSLALNLERLRILSHRLPSRALVVNIPAFTLTFLVDGKAEWQTRVIVGKPSWQTPQFDSTITRLELNPYWNVPSSIARRELVPKIVSDPNYLAKHDMRVLAGGSGHAIEVEPSSVDWRRFPASGYRLRQDPGPNNPLGQVKFNVPNPYDVYLHDTPSKRLFDNEVRALSHGCVRVENAMELAARLLRDDPAWTAERLAAEAAAGRPLQISLAKPMPVAIVYLTAWVNSEGLVQFRRDLYQLDAAPAKSARPEGCGPTGFAAAL